MISRSEYLYIKDRILKLTDNIYQYMSTDERYQKYETFLRMSEADQQNLIEKWDAYYQSISASETYARFQEMSALFHATPKNMRRIREVGAAAQKSLDEGKFMPTPSSEDPRFLKHKIDSVLPGMQAVLDQFKAKKAEYENVYDAKKDGYEL